MSELVQNKVCSTKGKQQYPEETEQHFSRQLIIRPMPCRINVQVINLYPTLYYVLYSINMYLMSLLMEISIESFKHICDAIRKAQQI